MIVSLFVYIIPDCDCDDCDNVFVASNSIKICSHHGVAVGCWEEHWAAMGHSSLHRLGLCVTQTTDTDTGVHQPVECSTIWQDSTTQWEIRPQLAARKNWEWTCTLFKCGTNCTDILFFKCGHILLKKLNASALVVHPKCHIVHKAE